MIDRFSFMGGYAQSLIAGRLLFLKCKLFEIARIKKWLEENRDEFHNGHFCVHILNNLKLEICFKRGEMDLNQLEAFRNIARRQNISQAARDLYISQSALAKTLQQIEGELHTPLFNRDGKRICLNSAGELLLHYSDIASNSLKKAEELIQDKKKDRVNVVRVIFRTPIGNPVSALRGFMNENPETIPHVAFDSEVHGDYDLEVFETQKVFQGNQLIRVCSDRICLLLSKSHPLAQRNRSVAICELEGERFVGYQPWGRNTPFDVLCKEYGFSPRYALAHQQVEGILEYIQQGFLAVGPCVMWLNERNNNLIALPIAELNEETTIYVRIHEVATAQATLALAQHLRDHLFASYRACEYCFES